MAAGPQPGNKYVLVSYVQGWGPMGWGNHMPGIVSGMWYALATNRTFLLNYPGWSDFFNSPLDYTHSKLIQAEDMRNASTVCKRFTFDSEQQRNWAVTDDLEQRFGHCKIWYIEQHADYLLPLASSNPHYRAFMERYFPTWEVFWPLSHLLFRLVPRLQAHVDAFRQKHSYASSYVVGMQVRKVKLYNQLQPFTERFHALGRSLRRPVGAVPVKFFITADNPDTYKLAREEFGEAAIFTENSDVVGSTVTKGGNPGKDDLALVDMWLLSSSHAIIASMSSSFGACAAARAGRHPYYITDNRDSINSTSPYFSLMTSSEPCFYQGWWAARALSKEALAHYRTHPLFYDWQQCHTPVPTFQ